MRKLTIIVVGFAIIAFAGALYFIISKISPPTAEVAQTPTASYSYQTSPTSISQKPTQKLPLCQQNQLSANATSQGAAGNIYVKLVITNSGKTACTIVLGDTITLQFYGQNITKHYEQDVPTEYFTLAPSEKVYSQIHYPNGPQCQSGITQKQTDFLYFVPQTSFEIDLNTPGEKLIIPICNSESEITTIDMWPLSKTPINP